MTNPMPVPDACTLPTAEQPLRIAEFDSLFATILRQERPSDRHLRLDLTAGADVVRDLARRESECCSFFTFTVTTPEAGRVRLDIEVPSAHIDVLNALADRAGTR